MVDFLRQVIVYDCGLTKMRFGNQGDGGYIMLVEPCYASSYLYSFGIGDDVSFELDVVRKFPRIKVKMFDPFITDLPENHDNFEFYKQSISRDSLPLVGVEHNSILKMDIEYNEWEFINKIGEDVLQEFSQLIIEFHFLHVTHPDNLSPYFQKLYSGFTDGINQELFSRYHQCLHKINKFFYCYHVHANNSLPEIKLFDSKFPPLLEMSFIRKNLVNFSKPYRGEFPIPGLDYPNKPDRPDIVGCYPWR